MIADILKTSMCLASIAFSALSHKLYYPIELILNQSEQEIFIPEEN